MGHGYASKAWAAIAATTSLLSVLLVGMGARPLWGGCCTEVDGAKHIRWLVEVLN